jgi:hypothetical protein
MGVLRSNRHYAVDDATVLQDTISLADTQMPEVGWIDALRRYNLGGTSWCIPRRGTAEYEKVMMLRKGAEDVKPQPRRRTIKARIKEEKPEPEPESHAEIPMVAEKPVDRTEEINEEIKKELADGKVSVSYDLGWKPATKETIVSGAYRPYQAGDYKWVLGLTEKPDVMDLAKLQEIADMKETEENKDRRNLAKDLLTRIKAWRPINAYFGRHSTYDIKKGEAETALKPALVDYKEFAEEVNKYRGTPIRNITYRSKFNPDGTRTMDMYWTITRRYNLWSDTKKYHESTTPYYHRYYQLEPEFKVLRGSTTVKAMKEEEEKEKAEAEKAKAEKEAKKEADPRTAIKKKLEEVRSRVDDAIRDRGRVEIQYYNVLNTTGANDPQYEVLKQKHKDLDVVVRQRIRERDAVEKELRDVAKQMKKQSEKEIEVIPATPKGTLQERQGYNAKQIAKLQELAKQGVLYYTRKQRGASGHGGGVGTAGDTLFTYYVRQGLMMTPIARAKLVVRGNQPMQKSDIAEFETLRGKEKEATERLTDTVYQPKGDDVTSGLLPVRIELKPLPPKTKEELKK